MTKQRVDELQQRYVQQQVRLEFMALLSSAEMARYAPSGDQYEQDYEKQSRCDQSISRQLN
jgi:hypothetical protein